MKSKYFGSFVMVSGALVALFVAGCEGRYTIAGAPAPSGPASTNSAVQVNAEPPDIILKAGDAIGVNTFPDGDTQSGGQGQKIDFKLGCHARMSEIFHIHAHLSIFDPSGTQIMVPWGVGIVQPYTFDKDNDEILTGTCFYNLHTHDRSGIIHDEASKDLNLTLGNFFDIWGMPLSMTNVAGYSGTVWVKIITPQGEKPWSNTIDPRTLLLTEHEQITLSVGQPVKPVPEYKFTF
jgi:hypothetical protein